MPATVSLRIGALLSSIASTTILRGFSSLIETISPAWMPSKLTGPPLRRPAAEPPSKTMRIGLLLCALRIFCTVNRPANPAAITASVTVPIARLLARIIPLGLAVQNRTAPCLGAASYGQRRGSESSMLDGPLGRSVVQHDQRV